MLGLLLIYFLGKKFYELAFEYKRKPWPYAILGVVTYYGSLLLFGFILGIIMAVSGNTAFFELNDFVLTLICIPVGLLSSWGLYKILENNWKKKPVTVQNELIDDL